MVEFLDKLQNAIHRWDVRVGAVVGAPFLVDGARLEYARQILVGDADAGVGFAVF